MRLLAAVFVGCAAALASGLAMGCAVAVPGLGVRARSTRPDHRLWLVQAGVGLSPLQFWGSCLLVGATAFALLGVVTSAPLVAVVPSLAIAMLPRAYFARRRAARLDAVHDAWPDGLRDLVASVSAGRSLTQAVVALAEGGPEPLRMAFATFPERLRVLGATAALESVRDELADPASDRVIEVLLVAHERGGSAVRNVLEDLVAATTKDAKLREEIETDGLEMRINARAVLVLPWLVLVALTIRPGAFRDFYQSTAGLAVVAVGGALSVLGGAWLARLGRRLDEPRVFGGPALEVAR